ncbi:MAG: YbhN family protein [Chloroflexota bacterium]
MISRWLIRLVGVGLFVLVLSRLELAQLGQLLRRTDGLAVALAIVLVFPFFVLKSWRWQLLLKRAGIHVSLWRSLWLYFVGLFAGYATPGQVGEAVKAVYLARAGHPMGPALATIALDRILDMLLLVLLAIPGVLFVGETLGMDRLFTLGALLAGLFGLLMSVWAIITPGVFRPLLGALYRIPMLGKRFEALLGNSSFHADLGLAMIVRSPALWLLTVAAYVVHYIRFYILLLALNITAPPPVLAFVATLALVSVVALIPITVMGVGTRDGVLVLAAGGLGLTQEEAVGFSLLILVTYLANLVIGLVCWLGDQKVAKA